MVNESEGILDNMASETDVGGLVDDSLAKQDQVVDVAQLLEELQKSNDQNLDMLKELRRS